MSAGDVCRHPTGSLVNFYEFLDANSTFPDRCEWKQYCAECGTVLAQGWDPKDDVNAPDADHHHVMVGDYAMLKRLEDWHAEIGKHCIEAADRKYRNGA